MKHHLHICSIFVAVLAGPLTGCPDPARDKTAARITTAANAPAAQGTRLAITPDNSRIEWVGSKVTRSHDGGFKNFSGTLTVDHGKLTGIEIEIDITSIWADNSMLQGHLLKDEFFAVARFPKAMFISTEITPEEITGNLTIRGVSKSITFPARIEITETHITIDSEFKLARKQFGIEYQGMPDNLVRDDVVIKVRVRSPLS